MFTPGALAGSRCTSAPIMTGVPPPERALYNQKIILLFPVAALILSSSKQPWEVWRRTTGTIPTPANNTQVLQCRHDYTRDKAFLFSLSSSHAPPVAHTSGKYMEGTRAGRAAGSVQPASAGSLAGLFFLAVSCWCGCAKPVTHTLAGPLQTPTHHLGVVLRCPRKNEHRRK